MIARHWTGWAAPDNAHLYEKYWNEHLLAELHTINGFRGAYLLRRDTDLEVQFITITLWESLDSIKAFAGDDYNIAVISAEARRVLSRFETTALHYEVLIKP